MLVISLGLLDLPSVGEDLPKCDFSFFGSSPSFPTLLLPCCPADIFNGVKREREKIQPYPAVRTTEDVSWRLKSGLNILHTLFPSAQQTGALTPGSDQPIARSLHLFLSADQ